MGYYINPKVGTKEDWLKEHALSISEAEARHFFSQVNNSPSTALLILVTNEHFTALGVVCNERERARFMDRINDFRPKLYFTVNIAILDSRAGLPDSFPQRLKEGLA